MIHFDEKTHTYTLNGKTLISVTQLMNKHGLSPDYSGVDPEILERAAARGTLVHKEIENFIKKGEFGFTREMMMFRDYMREKELAVNESETIVYDDLIAGTIDLILVNLDHEMIVADIKTTASLNQEAVSWQLTLYNYLIGHIADRAQVFHFDADGELKVVDIPFKPKEEIDRLIECERNGEIYRPQNFLTESQVMALRQAEAIIAAADAQKKDAEMQVAQIKAALMAEMEKRAIKSFETDRVKLTYVFPYERTTIDSKKLKKDHPKIAEQYSKTSTVAASLQITIKE